MVWNFVERVGKPRMLSEWQHVAALSTLREESGRWQWSNARRESCTKGMRCTLYALMLPRNGMRCTGQALNAATIRRAARGPTGRDVCWASVDTHHRRGTALSKHV
jgi:hypothetical protein